MASLQISLKIALPPIDNLTATASISASFKHAKHLALIPSSTWGGRGRVAMGGELTVNVAMINHRQLDPIS